MNTQYLFLIILILFGFNITKSHSQTSTVDHCGFDEMRSLDPDYDIKQHDLDLVISNYIRNGLPNNSIHHNQINGIDPTTTFIISVVIHVIHPASESVNCTSDEN